MHLYLDQLNYRIKEKRNELTNKQTQLILEALPSLQGSPQNTPSALVGRQEYSTYLDQLLDIRKQGLVEIIEGEKLRMREKRRLGLSELSKLL